MTKSHFTISTTIAAPAERVWRTMFEDASYRVWTKAFCDGSYFVGTWATGSKMLFLAPNGSGMVATIAENRPYAFLSIRQLGVIESGVEDTTSEAVRAWAPAFENYTLTETDGKTLLRLDQEVIEEYAAYLSDTWPKALATLKDLCERGA